MVSSSVLSDLLHVTLSSVALVRCAFPSDNEQFTADQPAFYCLC
jgi:hypothetical protein